MVFGLVLFQVLVILACFLVLGKATDIAISKVIGISRYLRIPEFTISFLLIGLIAVLPELFIGVNSVLDGSPSFGLGVIFGSNIADLTLIIGIVALSSRGLRLQQATVRELDILLLAIALPVILLLDGELSRIDGVILLATFFFYVWRIFKNNTHRYLNSTQSDNVPQTRRMLFAELLFLLGAIAVIFVSAHFIVESAKELSILLSFPVFFVGILVALGTCLPELTISLKSAGKSHTEIGVGDVLGNVFADCLAVIGLLAILSPIKSDPNFIIVGTGMSMVFAFLLLLFLFHSKKQLSKTEGLLLVMVYVIFIVLQFIVETGALAA